MKAVELSAVEQYYEDLNAPAANWPNAYFEEASYSIWAAKEIINEIVARPRDSVITIVEDFMHRMERYSHNNVNQGHIFLIAQRTAANILDVLTAMNG